MSLNVHKDIDGGGEYLPFALAKLKSLRATGLRYASQSFQVGDATITVRIEGDQSFVKLRAGAGGYLCLPHSDAHPDGVTDKDGTTVAPTAVVEILAEDKTNPTAARKWKLKENKRVAAGSHDWRGTVNGKPEILTFNLPHNTRYRLPWLEEAYGETYVYQSGRKVKVSMPSSFGGADVGVLGAGIFKDAAGVSRRVVACRDVSSGAESYVRLAVMCSAGGQWEIIGFVDIENDRSGGHEVFITDPVYFSPDGAKFTFAARKVSSGPLCMEGLMYRCSIVSVLDGSGNARNTLLTRSKTELLTTTSSDTPMSPVASEVITEVFFGTTTATNIVSMGTTTVWGWYGYLRTVGPGYSSGSHSATEDMRAVIAVDFKDDGAEAEVVAVRTSENRFAALVDVAELRTAPFYGADGVLYMAGPRILSGPSYNPAAWGYGAGEAEMRANIAAAVADAYRGNSAPWTDSSSYFGIDGMFSVEMGKAASQSAPGGPFSRRAGVIVMHMDARDGSFGFVHVKDAWTTSTPTFTTGSTRATLHLHLGDATTEAEISHYAPAINRYQGFTGGLTLWYYAVGDGRQSGCYASRKKGEWVASANLQRALELSSVSPGMAVNTGHPPTYTHVHKDKSAQSKFSIGAGAGFSVTPITIF